MLTDERKYDLLYKRTINHMQEVELLLVEIKKNKDKMAALKLKMADESSIIILDK